MGPQSECRPAKISGDPLLAIHGLEWRRIGGTYGVCVYLLSFEQRAGRPACAFHLPQSGAAMNRCFAGNEIQRTHTRKGPEFVFLNLRNALFQVLDRSKRPGIALRD